MMNNQKLSPLNKRYLWVALPVVLAMLFVASLISASASSSVRTTTPTYNEREPSSLSNGTVITIGVASAMTVFPDLAWRQINAVQLAVDQVNDAGGIDIGGTTYTVSLVTAESGCDSTQAVNAANTLISAGAVAVVGHSCSGASIAAQPIYNMAGVTMITPSSTSPLLTEQGYTTTFRTISRHDSAAKLMATYFHGWLGLNEIALVEWDAVWLMDITDAFSNTFTSLGGTITSRHTVSSTEDYTSTLTSIQPENPEAIFYVDIDPNNAGLFSSIADNLGMNIIGWNSDGSDPDAYVASAGAGAEDDYNGISWRRAEDMPGYEDLNTAYQEAGFPNYGDEVQIWGAFAYDAANIIMAAIDHADSTDPANIREEIAATNNYQGVVGTYEGFDAKGDVIPQWASLEYYKNGQWTILHPSKIFLPTTIKNTGP
jgi:branched-chain amino acid transport system substrate-binding protein